MSFGSFPFQILQCLSISGLTSSGGGSTGGGDGGSSGASRAIVKDRWVFNCMSEFFSLRNVSVCVSFNISIRILFSGLRHSILCSKNFIRNNLNGQFQIQSCESLLDLQWLKSYCLPIDHLLNVLGEFSHFYLHINTYVMH